MVMYLLGCANPLLIAYLSTDWDAKYKRYNYYD